MSTRDEAEEIYNKARHGNKGVFVELIAAALEARNAEIADLRAKLAEVTKRHDDLWEMDRKIIGDLNAKLAEAEAIIRQHFTSTQPDLPALVRQLLQAWVSERDNAITAEQRIASLEEAQEIRVQALRQAEQRAREGEIRTLERAIELLDGLPDGIDCVNAIDREIDRLKGEKGEG